MVLGWGRKHQSSGKSNAQAEAKISWASNSRLVGRGTCTHLNDTLRALADVAELSELSAVR